LSIFPAIFEHFGDQKFYNFASVLTTLSPHVPLGVCTLPGTRCVKLCVFYLGFDFENVWKGHTIFLCHPARKIDFQPKIENQKREQQILKTISNFIKIDLRQDKELHCTSSHFRNCAQRASGTCF
jgi:hypothetical protein